MSIDRLFQDPKPVLIESIHPSVILAFLQEARDVENEILFLSGGTQPRPLLALKRLIIAALYEENISLEEWGKHFDSGENAEEFIRFCREELGIESSSGDYYVTGPGILEKSDWKLLFDQLRFLFERKRLLVILDWARIDSLTRYFITTYAAEIPLTMVIFSHEPLYFEHLMYMPEVKAAEPVFTGSYLYDYFGASLPEAIFGDLPQAASGLKYGPYLLFLEPGKETSREEQFNLLHTIEEEKKGYFDWADRYSLERASMSREDKIRFLEEKKKRLSGSMNISAAIYVNETLTGLLPEGLPRLHLYLDDLFPLYDAVQYWEKGESIAASFSVESLPEREKAHLCYYKALFSVKGGDGSEASGLEELCRLARDRKWVREYYDILSLLCYRAYMASEYEEAEECSRRLLGSKLLPRNPERDIEALNILGFIRENKSEWEKAYEYLKKALDLAVEKRLPLKEVMMNANIGLFYTYTKDYSRAVEVLEEALYGALRADVKMIVGNVYGNLGIVFADQGQMGRSLVCYEKALRIFREIGYRRGIYIAQEYMALNYYKMKDEKSALLYYATLEKMLREWGEKRLLARSQANFGRVYLHLKGNGERAAFYLTQSIRAEKKMGVQEWQWDVPVLIDAFLREGDTEKAREAFGELELQFKEKKLPEKLWKEMDLRKMEIEGREGTPGAKERLLDSLKGADREDPFFWETQFLLEDLFRSATVSREELLSWYQAQSSPEAFYRLSLLQK